MTKLLQKKPVFVFFLYCMHFSSYQLLLIVYLMISYMIDMLLIHGDFTVGPIFYFCILFSCFILVTNEHPAPINKGKKRREKWRTSQCLCSIFVLLYLLFSSDGVNTFLFADSCQILITFYGYLSQGILTNETRCLRCETVTARDETFFDLSLDIEQNSSITSCLKNFSSTETLNAEDKFFCDKCCRQAAFIILSPPSSSLFSSPCYQLYDMNTI